ncbi:unnamed protein product, partial [Scytosiphon promiscuus]
LGRGLLHKSYHSTKGVRHPLRCLQYERLLLNYMRVFQHTWFFIQVLALHIMASRALRASPTSGTMRACVAVGRAVRLLTAEAKRRAVLLRACCSEYELALERLSHARLHPLKNEVRHERAVFGPR